MDIKLCFLTLLCCRVTLQTKPTVHKLEAENECVRDKLSPVSITDRRDASNRKVVLLYGGESASLHICLNSKTRLQVKDLRYGCHGDPCEFSLMLQHIMILEIQSDNDTSKRAKKNSNRLVSIPQPVLTRQMRPGRFELELKVQKAGKRGVQIDYIELGLENKQSVGELTCKVHCMYNINYRRAPPRFRWLSKSVHKPFITQKSFETACAEEDNINVPVFVENLQTLKITAAFPKYQSFSNERTPDFENCAMVSALWTFEEIIFESDDRPGLRYHKASIGPKHTKHVHGDVTALITGINSRKMTINVKFKLEGQAIGVVDADIGSRLVIKLRGILKSTDVIIKYRGRHRQWVKGEIKTFTDFLTVHTWEIPDFTWTEHDFNYIYVEIRYPWQPLRKFAEIEKIELSRRHKEPTRFFHMFNDGKYLMEGADIDFWWLINQTMTVRILETGELFPIVDYFRIYSKIPWSKDLFSQIFVLYQDGYVRLLPVSPHGVDWIPFGSSILIGQSNVSSPRPSAPIKHVDVSMADLVLHIYYLNGDYIAMKVQPKFHSTVISVESASFRSKSENMAFLTFRSMYVANGNADVDHVSVDGVSHHIISDGWSSLKGFYFAFFRKCISKHNSLSPDIIIEIDENINGL